MSQVDGFLAQSPVTSNWKLSNQLVSCNKLTNPHARASILCCIKTWVLVLISELDRLYFDVISSKHRNILSTLIFVTLMASPLSTYTSSSFSLKMDITIVSNVIENIPVAIFGLICQLLFLLLWWRHPCQLTPRHRFHSKWTSPSCQASSKTYLYQFSA